MTHKPILIKDLDLSFPHKTCFENFSCQIAYGSRIAIIGRNGSGKSTLLNMTAAYYKSSKNMIKHALDINMAYIPQMIENYESLSGGERFDQAMIQALSLKPDILLLDEPTNHLDQRNRKNLMRRLQKYSGTLIVVTHDTELLHNCINTLWHIDNGKIKIISGNYNDYIHEIKLKRTSIEKELEILSRKKRDMHSKLMQEQQRAAKSKAKGEKKVENRKWLKMVGDLKGMKAEKSQGKKLRALDSTKEELTAKLNSLQLPDIIVPKFSIEGSGTEMQPLVQIRNGLAYYIQDKPVLTQINLSLASGDRLAITGDNGSGKSTLIKAILGDESVLKAGDWFVTNKKSIGYLDQHYNTLDPSKTVIETIAELVPQWSHTQVRCCLNDFLFRKNEEVNSFVRTLSGGEKVRLSLAQIAAKTLKLLILDEITNNLDLETREHVIQVLKAYTGSMIIISHDIDFLRCVEIKEIIDIEKFK